MLEKENLKINIELNISKFIKGIFDFLKYFIIVGCRKKKNFEFDYFYLTFGNYPKYKNFIDIFSSHSKNSKIFKIISIINNRKNSQK